jgi:hypothetical protein
MKEMQVQERTVKVIFEEYLGPKIATEVLGKIQSAYNDGVRGEKLQRLATELIVETGKSRDESRGIVMVAIAIIVV